MYASELAQELALDPSVITKRLAAYRAETGQERSRLLDTKTVGHMREVHRLLQSRTASTTREAVRRVLGQWSDTLPAEEAHELVQRVAVVEATLGRIEQLVTEMHAIVQTRDRQRSRATSERLDTAPQVNERTLDESFAALISADALSSPDGLSAPPSSLP
ncbi:hypothetical protein ACI3L1_07720 [Deinococcus sp. SM5_A1]|uniref:hypothetical protein n=1 Tax=Deinococcus sp. SM5_A1 TaxID=3379094 RepID=UPI00385F1D5A